MKNDLEQEIASKYIKNHSLIIAGAGTGKTTTLIKKIEYLIQNNTEPKEILVISFTNETVNNFKSKCKYNIDVFTFHKLAMNIIEDKYYLIDDDYLNEIIYQYLKIIPIKMKKKIYHIYNKFTSLYNKKKYKLLLQKKSSTSIINTIKNIIQNIKAYDINIEKLEINALNKKEIIQLYITKEILKAYNKYLKENSLIDFDELIINATKKLIYNKNILKYKYVLVDEYQDISPIRLNFLKSIINNSKSILTAVGDDYQSIYGFSGSNIKYIYNFESCFTKSKTFFINTTYRCPKNVIDIAGNFIIKNKCQIKKKLVSNKIVNNNIHKIYYSNGKKELYKILKKLKQLDKEILILSRNNYDINKFINKNIKIENSYIIFNDILYKNIRFLSIHKSKGLEADIIIILNLSNKKNGFPSKKENTLLNKIIGTNENIKFPEERRLFYVALTRTKDSIYLFIDKNNPSIFVKEIKKLEH